MRKNKWLDGTLTASCIAALLGVAACGGSGTSGEPVVTAVACMTQPTLDSLLSADGLSFTRIVSHLSTPAPTYGMLITRYGTDGSPVTVEYMIHDATDPATGNIIPGKALLVLIAGGQLTAFIDGIGSTVTNSGGNFLVRSAHLFAAQGYRVVTIDQPSDAATVWIPPGNTFGSAMDGYRVSPAHAVDLARIIDVADPNRGLPVVLAGTSRGAISSVAQAALAQAVALSSPVTAGSSAGVYPVGSTQADPARVGVPARVVWHVNDGCWASTPAAARALVGQFASGSGVPVHGGFVNPAAPQDVCGAFSYHGFLGIESCAVEQHTSWLDGLALAKPAGAVPSITLSSVGGASVSFDAGNWVPPGGNVVLPHGASVHGGSVSLVGALLSYAPPAGLTGTTDSFVYVVRSADGALKQGVISVTLS